MTRFALTLEFDGRPFMGLQRQAHGPSVQQAVEEAAFAVTGERVTLHSAGRTDAGVHALAMRAHLDIAKDLAALEAAAGGTVTFGSYPWFAPPDSFGVHLVARSVQQAALAKAGEDLRELVRARGVDPEEVDESA